MVAAAFGGGGRRDMDELFVDPNQVVREAIVSALKPYARLAAVGWAFYPEPNFGELDAQQRMLVVLIGRKASHIAEKVDTDRISKSELCSLAAVGEGTYAPYAPKMERAGLIQREGDELWIPNEAVVRAANVVLGRAPAVGETGARASAPRRKGAPPIDMSDEQSPGRTDQENTLESADDEAGRAPNRQRRNGASSGPYRARSTKDFLVLYSGKADLSAFPHPDELRDSVRVSLLPLLVARDAYRLEGLPLREISTFLREKYGREMPEQEIEAALNSVRARYVDTRLDSHMNRTIYCLLEQGRAFLAQPRGPEFGSEGPTAGTAVGD